MSARWRRWCKRRGIMVAFVLVVFANAGAWYLAGEESRENTRQIKILRECIQLNQAAAEVTPECRQYR